MKALILLTLLSLFTGCGMTREAQQQEVSLEVVKMNPLPQLADGIPSNLKLHVLVHILSDGTVQDVKLLSASGNAEWDSQAVKCIQKWIFSPPLRDGVPAEVWARQVLVVHVMEPIPMTLGRMTFKSKAEADSLRRLIEEGKNFDTEFKRTEEMVDLATFPQRVREQLKRLDILETSQPIRLGDSYVIFKRFIDPTSGVPS